VTSRRTAANAVLLCASLLATEGRAEKLQLYVMPDTQTWAANQGGGTLETWRSVADALCRERERFAMVLHTGDMVDTPRLRPEQWRNALSAMQRLDACRMPYAIAFGNHDFDDYPSPRGEMAATGDRSWSALRAQLAHQPIEKSPTGRTGLHPLAPGWSLLAMDFRPTGSEQRWIESALSRRAGDRFVLLHHDCVNLHGIASTWCREFLERHPEIRAAISGHWLGEQRDGWQRVARASGPPLIALYQNYQHIPELAAWGAVVELDPISGGLCVWSENLLNGALTHPAASWRGVGHVRAGPPRTCFEGAGPR
jgi:hypothetical protein